MESFAEGDGSLTVRRAMASAPADGKLDDFLAEDAKSW
jgi:hypothetical protein